MKQRRSRTTARLAAVGLALAVTGALLPASAQPARADTPLDGGTIVYSRCVGAYTNALSGEVYGRSPDSRSTYDLGYGVFPTTSTTGRVAMLAFNGSAPTIVTRPVDPNSAGPVNRIPITNIDSSTVALAYSPDGGELAFPTNGPSAADPRKYVEQIGTVPDADGASMTRQDVDSAQFGLTWAWGAGAPGILTDAIVDSQHHLVSYQPDSPTPQVVDDVPWVPATWTPTGEWSHADGAKLYVGSHALPIDLGATNGHANSAYAYAFSPNGTWVVVNRYLGYPAGSYYPQYDFVEYSLDGTRSVQLIGADTQFYCGVAWAPGASPLKAAFTATQTGRTTGHLDASGSGPSVVNYTWSFTDPHGTTTSVDSASPTVDHDFGAQGTAHITLTVTDAYGQVASVSHDLELKGIVVNSTGDTANADTDGTVCDTGAKVGDDPECTLRAAIQTAVANGGGDIGFAIDGAPDIAVGSQLPDVSKPITVDGTTQSGGMVGVTGSADIGLKVTSSGVSIKGLALGGFTRGVEGDGAQGLVLQGDRIGYDRAGTTALPGQYGITLRDAAGSVIGGSAAGQANQVTGTYWGVELVPETGGSVAGTTVVGNHIGTDAAGGAALAPPLLGVGVAAGGYADAGGAGDHVTFRGNAIASTEAGVVVSGANTATTTVDGNRVGVAAGGGTLGSTLFGIRVEGSAATVVSNDQVGGASSIGVLVAGSQQGAETDDGLFAIPADIVTSNPVTGGGESVTDTTVDASTATYGIQVAAGDTNATLSGDRVTGPATTGVAIGGGSGHVITDTTVGVTVAGAASEPSTGISVDDTAATVGPDNVVAGATVGISVGFGKPAGGTVVTGNKVGTDGTTRFAETTGIAAYSGTTVTLTGNDVEGAGTGIKLSGSDSAPLSAVSITDNTVVANQDAGIDVFHVDGLTLSTNRIGVDATGRSPAPQAVGVLLDAVTGGTSMTGDTIAGNTSAGVRSTGATLAMSHETVGAAGSANGTGVVIGSGTATVTSSTVAYATTAGIVVGPGATATVQHTSIHDAGTGPADGIRTATGPSTPTLAAAVLSASGQRTWVAVTGLPTDETGTLELFADPGCTGAEATTPLLTQATTGADPATVLVVKDRPITTAYTITYTDARGTSAISTCGDTTADHPDTDGDGIPDVIESLAPAPLGAAAAASSALTEFPRDAGGFGFVVTSSGTLAGVTPVDASNPPAGASPTGTIAFTVQVAHPGDEADVLAGPAALHSTWWKYGPSAPGGDANWAAYPFSKTGTVTLPDGTILAGTTIVLVDGGNGDQDFTPNGLVVDPGGVYDAPESTPTPPPVTTTAPPTATAPPTGFATVGPVRVLDTRTGTGAPQGKVGPDGTITLTIPNLPAGTAAVVLNLTATDLAGSPSTYVSVCPAEQALPACTITSALNVVQGVDVANEIVVPVGPDGKVTLDNNAGSVHLVADLTGFLTGGFTAAGPTRVLDTRSALRAPRSPVGPRSTLTVTLPNLPAGTSAVVLNLTGTGLTGAPTTYVSACPLAQSAAACTTTSALNVATGQTVANEITVPVGPDGKLVLYNNAGNLDLVADVAGYLTGGFTPVDPTRVLDTRTGLGAATAQVGPQGTITLSLHGVPAGTSAVVLNLTGTRLAGAPTTYVSACPAARAPCRGTSALNVVAGRDVANELVVPVGTDGTITLYVNAGGLDLVADVVGYLAGT